MIKERLHWIDIAKGIAILCVFFGHTISTPSAIQSFVYFFHMPTFFMLSGYVFSDRRKLGDFLTTKLKTVVLPIFTLGLSGAIVVNLLLQFVKHESVDWKWTFLNPIVQYGEHSLLWYLAALFVASVVLYALVKLFKQRVAPLVITTFMLGLGSYCFIRFTDVTLPWSIDTALVALPFMSVGYALKKKEAVEKLGKWWALLIAFVSCAVFGILNQTFFSGVEMHTNSYGNIFLFYVSAMSGCVMVISASLLIKKSTLLEYFGRNSLIFYALEPIQYFANFALKVTGFDRNSSLALSLIVSIAVVAAICAASSAASGVINRFFPFLIGKKRERV